MGFDIIEINLVFAPFWNNTIIQKNRKAIKKSDFPEIANKISIVADFYDQETGALLTKREFDQKYECLLTNETMVELHYIINTARAGLGINNNVKIPFSRPIQPLLIKIINVAKKGCSAQSKLLRKKDNSTGKLSEREKRWHLELQKNYGVDFWNRTYSLAASIKNENKLKFFQFQINRNSLFTNYKVNNLSHMSPLFVHFAVISMV